MVDQFSQCYEILVDTIIKTKTRIEHSKSYMNDNLTHSNGAVAIDVSKEVPGLIPGTDLMANSNSQLWDTTPNFACSLTIKWIGQT